MRNVKATHTPQRRRIALLLTLAVSIVSTMLMAPTAGAAVSGDTSFTPPTFTFTADSLGANDEPGQKDLTAHSTALTSNLFVAWKWDEIGLSGGNTGDACALFDTDTDGNINDALCVTIAGKPATWQSTRVYTCGDTKNDRCTSTYTEVTPIGSRCQVNNEAVRTFIAGSGAFDTQATCRVALADFGSSTAALVNTCSYPSREPTSAPSDCVLIPGVRETGAIEVSKTGADANCTGTTLPAGCQSAGVNTLAGAHFAITGTDVPPGAEDLVTSSTDGKVCFAGLPTGNTYTVTETTPPTGYQINDLVLDDPLDTFTQGVQSSKSVTVSSAGTCESGATPVSVTFNDSPVSTVEVIFTAPGPGITLSKIECAEGSTVIADDDGDSTPSALDDTDETYSDLTAGTYTCTININP